MQERLLALSTTCLGTFSNLRTSFRNMVGRKDERLIEANEAGGAEYQDLLDDDEQLGPTTKREHLTLDIQLRNPSASTDWLSTFSERALENYLSHLTAMEQPRGRSSVWVRRAETPAVQGFVLNAG